MADKTISIGEAYNFGWTVFKSNIGYFAKIFAIIIAGHIVLITVDILVGALLYNLVISTFGIVIGIGLIKITITFVRGAKPLVSDLWASYQLFFKYLFSAILYNLIVFVGLILFIIPGVIWSLKFSQFQYLIVDKRKGPIEALKESSKLTEGVKWKLLGFLIVALLVNTLGAVFFYVGMLITLPVTWLAFAHVYQQLLDQEKPEVSGTSTPSTPETETKPELEMSEGEAMSAQLSTPTLSSTTESESKA